MIQTAPILPGLGICIRSTAPRRLSDVGSVKSKFTVRACPMLHSSRPPASHQNAAHRAAGHSAGRLVSPVDCEPNAKAGGSLWSIWQPRSQALSRARSTARRRRFHDFGAGRLWTRIFFRFRSMLYLKANVDSFRSVYGASPESNAEVLREATLECRATPSCVGCMRRTEGEHVCCFWKTCHPED